MNRIKITENRVVACFAAILLLLPSTAGAQHFDAHIAGRKVTLQECFDLAARQNLQMQAGKKSVERAQVMQGTAWELDKTEVTFSQTQPREENQTTALPSPRTSIFLPSTPHAVTSSRLKPRQKRVARTWSTSN